MKSVCVKMIDKMYYWIYEFESDACLKSYYLQFTKKKISNYEFKRIIQIENNNFNSFLKWKLIVAFVFGEIEAS